MFERAQLLNYNKDQLAQYINLISELERGALLNNAPQDQITSAQTKVTNLRKWIKSYQDEPHELLKKNLASLKYNLHRFSREYKITDPLISIFTDSLRLGSINLDITYCNLPKTFAKLNRDDAYRIRLLILLGFLIDLEEKVKARSLNIAQDESYNTFLRLLQKIIATFYHYNEDDLTLKTIAQNTFNDFKILNPRNFEISEEHLQYQTAYLRLNNVAVDNDNFFHKQAKFIAIKVDFVVNVYVKPNYKQATHTLNLVYDYLVASDPNVKADIVNDLIQIAKHSPGAANMFIKLTGALIAFIGAAIALASLVALPFAFGFTSPLNIFGIVIGSTVMTKGLALCGLIGGMYVAKQGMQFFNAGCNHNVAKAIHGLVDEDNTSSLPRRLLSSFR